jgi:hypothetical protein
MWSQKELVSGKGYDVMIITDIHTSIVLFFIFSETGFCLRLQVKTYSVGFNRQSKSLSPERAEKDPVSYPLCSLAFLEHRAVR